MHMRSHIGMVILAGLVVLVLLISTVAYKVSFMEFGVIRTFGATTKVVDGRTEAGLHFKAPWPIQRLIRYDARTFVFEDTAGEVPTRDKQNLLVTMYCAWRISDPADFQTTLTTASNAESFIRDLLRSAKKDAISGKDMSALVNTDPAKMEIPEVEQQVLRTIQRQAADSGYGVEIVRVGIKNLGLPQPVSETVIEAMKEERQREVRRYEAAGEAQATAIRVRAETAAQQILEFARRRAAAIRSEGIRRAAEAYAEYEGNEQFSMFLRYLESLETELASRSVIVLDASQLPAIEWFRKGPSLPEAPAPPAATRPATGQAGGE